MIQRTVHLCHKIMHAIRKPLQLLACILLLLVVCQPENSTTSTLAEMWRAFAWFDTLGFPDLLGKKYVRVATGYWRKSSDAPPENTYIQAFLLTDDGEQFRVFTANLETFTFTKTLPSVEEYERVGYEMLDLHSEVTAELEELFSFYEEGDVIGRHWRLCGKVGERLELFVFARACAANDLWELAYQVYTSTLALSEDICQSDQKTLHEVVEDEIAYTIMWRNVLAFEDVTVSRQELLERFEQFIENFPESEYTARAREMAVLLRQMVREDKEYARRAKSLETMTLEECIAELVFQLRDQNGHQWSQPGWCDIFSDERGRDSPAYQLVEIGYPAIPQLIAALDDERFTRSVGFHRDFYFSHFVLRVGDAALAVIERIAGRRFYQRHSTTSEAVKDGEIASVKAEVEAWWREFQEKGEKQMLVEAVVAGNHNSPSQARLLVERYPNELLGAITKGLLNTEESWVHSQLVAIVAELEEETPIPLLLSVVESAPYLSSRVIAAKGLQRHGCSEGIAAMIEEWSEQSRSGPGDADSQEELAEFLAGCGDPEAIRVLRRSLRNWPVDIRFAVIAVFQDNRAFYHKFRAEGDDSCDDCESPEASAAIEELLIHTLDDTEEDLGLWVNWDDKSSYSPRICDLAGHELSQRWPARYEFDLEASLPERDRQLVVLENVWRSSRGLALLPLPQRLEIPRVPDEVIIPLLERIMQSPLEEDREAIEEIEALGLGALPAVRELLDRIEEEHIARPALVRLTTRLANIVREVVIVFDSVEPEQHVMEFVESLEGKPFTSERLVNLLTLVTQRPLPDSTSIEIQVDRMGDDTGIILKVRLTEAMPQESVQKRWVCDIHVMTDERSLGGYENYTCAQTEGEYKEFVEAWDQAQEAPPEEMLRLRLSIVQEH
jgi:hypothetical protein